MFEVRTTDDLIRIAAAGGGFVIKANQRSTDDLIRIAAAAAHGGGHVIYRGLAVRSTDDLIRISAAGKGQVIFSD